MDQIKIKKILKKVFQGFKVETYPGTPINKRFDRVQAYVKEYNSGDKEEYFIYKLYELIEETEKQLERE